MVKLAATSEIQSTETEKEFCEKLLEGNFSKEMGKEKDFFVSRYHGSKLDGISRTSKVYA